MNIPELTDNIKELNYQIKKLSNQILENPQLLDESPYEDMTKLVELEKEFEKNTAFLSNLIYTITK